MAPRYARSRVALSAICRRNGDSIPRWRCEEQLLFLARLAGLSKQDARAALEEWLERFQITANRQKKVEALSKGNQQKVQFLAAMLHNPTILIMDEPFSGLDPVNAAVLKEAFLEMHRRGKTIIFSTHQLEQVEELCEDMVLINKGQVVVQGSVQEIKRQHGRNVARLTLDNDPEAPWLEQLPACRSPSAARTTSKCSSRPISLPT